METFYGPRKGPAVEAETFALGRGVPRKRLTLFLTLSNNPNVYTSYKTKKKLLVLTDNPTNLY